MHVASVYTCICHVSLYCRVLGQPATSVSCAGSGGAQEYSLFKEPAGGAAAVWGAADHGVDPPPPQVRLHTVELTAGNIQEV